MTRRFSLVIAAVVSLITSAPESALAENFETWMNRCIVDGVTARIGTRDNSKTPETASISSNTTSLVDTATASDLIGMALSVAGLTASSNSGGDTGDATSGTATASAYAVYTAIAAKNPLDPGIYCRGGAWGAAELSRRLSLTLGFDDDNDAAAGSSPIIAGAKVLLYNGRSVCDPEAFGAVRLRLQEAAQQASKLSLAAQKEMFHQYESGSFADIPGVAPALPEAEFLEMLQANPSIFDEVVGRMGGCSLMFSTPEDIEPFVRLDSVTQEKVAEFERRPQLSFSFLTTQRDESDDDDYRAGVIFAYGLNTHLQLNLNASYDRVSGATTEGNGGRFAGELQFQPFRDILIGPKPFRVSLSGQGLWAEQQKPQYVGQLRLNLPIPRIQWLSGFELPISVTVANRTDLIDETVVRGMIGFSLDTAQVLAALQPM